MRTYRRETYIKQDKNLPEKEVFCSFIKEIRCYENDEVDFYKRSDEYPDMISRFSTMKMKDISSDFEQLSEDIINTGITLSIGDFWDKYEDKLKGKWYNDQKVIF